ncbi:DUF4234 domain-containing protein [Clostridium botulinum]|nr:DUF4234 domain-containing protein [Clostridium botulinum]NFI17528.1 DUF4234 domain-containing protein [Clostridium botulinum]NFI54563.1 DUF4234 domain-containing protein [Clostridium botulinum]NFL94436.1 DUF4234 domain-containing protein [Clostridium botulinum]NFN53185.1 DUF4234 domain-containing protein [Clostridium botulinum]
MIKKRNIAISILLSFITFGIYNLFWMGSLSNETSEYLNKPKSGVKEILIGIITLGLYFIYWNFKMGKRMYEIQENAGTKSSDNSMIYLILSIFGFIMIPVWIMQYDFNKISDL